MFFELTYFFTYYFILFYIFLSFVLSLFLIMLAIFLRHGSSIQTDIELSSSYECGFIPFDRARTRLEVKFFMLTQYFLIRNDTLNFFSLGSRFGKQKNIKN